MSAVQTLVLAAGPLDDPMRIGAAVVLLTAAAAGVAALRRKSNLFAVARQVWSPASTQMGEMLAEQATVHRTSTASVCSEIASQALPLLRVQPGAGGSARLTFGNENAIAVSFERPDQVAELTRLVGKGLVVLAGVDITESGRSALLFRSPSGLCSVVVTHATRVPAAAS